MNNTPINSNDNNANPKRNVVAFGKEFYQNNCNYLCTLTMRAIFADVQCVSVCVYEAYLCRRISFSFFRFTIEIVRLGDFVLHFIYFQFGT